MSKILAKNVLFKCRYFSGNADVVVLEYARGGLCIRLLDADTKEPLLTASVWTEDTVDLPLGAFFCKTYSENEGVLEGLVDAGICSDFGKLNGWPVLMLNSQYLAALEEQP